jgi:hypothetical protein
MYGIDIKQLEFLHRHQRAVLAWIETRFGMILVVTSLFRMDDDGVHGSLPLRGTDLRCHSDKVGYEMEAEINAHWVYDPARPEMKVAVYHDTGRGKHLHIQTHPNTYEV